MICPKCRKSKLTVRKVKQADFTIEHCPGCKGIWFDGGEFEKVLGTAAKELEVPSRAVKLRLMCPKCSKPLYVFHYPQTRIAIEMCKKCEGFWLDSGEFTEIRKVRKELKESGELEHYAEVGGLKGALIRLINSAIDDLSAIEA
ncbi:MAG: zf-TFIIB domain-containing protein [Planctomycetota bacterium]